MLKLLKDCGKNVERLLKTWHIFKFFNQSFNTLLKDCGKNVENSAYILVF